jgi:hypothetical protein
MRTAHPRLRVVLTSCVLALALIGLTASPAIAVGMAPGNASTVTEAVEGAEATCSVPEDRSRIDCTLKDTAPDEHSVFIQWQYGGENERFPNSLGSGQENSHGQGPLNYGDRTRQLSWKVCVDKQFRSDSCSRVVDYRPGQDEIGYQINCEDAIVHIPSPSIPSDAAITPGLPNCYSVTDPERFDAKCMEGVALAVAGIANEGRAWQKVGKFALKKVPLAGWALTGYGTYTAIREC